MIPTRYRAKRETHEWNRGHFRSLRFELEEAKNKKRRARGKKSLARSARKAYGTTRNSRERALQASQEWPFQLFVILEIKPFLDGCHRFLGFSRVLSFLVASRPLHSTHRRLRLVMAAEDVNMLSNLSWKSWQNWRLLIEFNFGSISGKIWRRGAARGSGAQKKRMPNAVTIFTA